MSYIAIDVHKTTSTVAYVNPATEHSGECKILTNCAELDKMLQRLAPPWIVAVEAAREAPAVCNWLQQLGAQVLLVNPEKLAAIAKLRPAKTDRKDAALILHALVNGYLPLAYLAPPHVVERRALSRGRLGLRRVATTMRNRLRIAFAHVGMHLPVRNLCGKLAREQMDQWLEQLPTSARLVADGFWQTLLHTEQQIARFDEQIHAQVDEDAVAQALCLIPGLGPISAFGIIAEIGQVERFASYKHLHSYAGLVPTVSASGDWRRNGPLSSRCNKNLQAMAIMATQSAVRSGKPSRAKKAFEGLRWRHGYNVAKVAAARKLLTDVYFTWWHRLDPAGRP